MRIWVTELRPLWRPEWMGDKHACAGDELLADPDQGNEVLLAQLTLTVGAASLTDPTWVQQAAAIIDEDARPFLLQTRLLQEWMLAQTSALEPAAILPELVSLPHLVTSSKVVAAGILSGNGSATTRAVLNNLRAASFTNVSGATHFVLTFDGYTEPPAAGSPQYIVKATPWTALHLTVAFAGFQPGGFILSLSKAGKSLTAADVATLELFVEVSQLS
jgi:hypothetical protein